MTDQAPQTSDSMRETLDEIRHGLLLVGRDLDDLMERNTRTTRNRLSLLHIHAATAVLVGGAVVLNGPEGIATPAYAGVRLIPGAPATVGAMLIIFGIVLGIATWFREIRWEMVAVVGMVGWYLLWATSFAYAVIAWQIDPVGVKPSYQGMFAYYGWAGLLIAHFRVLVWLNPHRKRGAE